MNLLRPLAAVMALLLAGCGAASAESGAPSPSPQSVTLGLSYIPNVQFSPAYVAADKELFGDTTVTLRHHGANEGLFTAVVAGQQDMVIAGGDEMLQARSQGMPLVAVGAYFTRHPVEVIARSDADISTLADLRGRTIGVPGRYGENWFGLLLALRQAGLTEMDVTVAEIGYTAQAAMASKKVDAVVGFSNNDAVQLRAAGVGITEIPIDTTALVSISIITTEQVLNEKPEAVRDVVKGIIAGAKRAVENPDAALDATATRVPSFDSNARDAASHTWEATAPLMTRGSKLDPAQWEKMQVFMNQAGLLETPVTIAEAVRTDVG